MIPKSLIDRIEYKIKQLNDNRDNERKEIKEGSFTEKYKHLKRIRDKYFPLFREEMEELKQHLPLEIWEVINSFGSFDEILKAINLFKIIHYETDSEKDISFIEKQLLYLNQIAWEYISQNNEFNWGKYKKLWNHPIWFLGVMTREKYEEIKNGERPIGSFHHEPPYRDHLLTLFTSGKFVKKHKKGKLE